MPHIDSRGSRRRFLISAGAAATTGLAGCSSLIGSNDGTNNEDSLTIHLPAETIHYPMYKAAIDNGFFADEGLDLQIEYKPFSAQLQAVSSGEVDVTMQSMIPYVNKHLQGEDLVTFGWDGCLQSINGLYCLADDDFQNPEDLKGQRIGVWSWGSSTVQAFQAVIAELTGLNLREDFESTTAAPPALLGLLENDEADGVINVSGLTITMESQPETYRRLAQLNNMWINETGNTLPLTSWWCHADWYQENTDTAAALLRGSQNATAYWRENTVDILQEYGDPASIDTDAKIDVVDKWSNDGQVFLQEADQSYIDSTWEFIELMDSYGFIDSAPAQDDVYRNPL